MNSFSFLTYLLGGAKVIPNGLATSKMVEKIVSSTRQTLCICHWDFDEGDCSGKVRARGHDAQEVRQALSWEGRDGKDADRLAW